MNYKKAMCFLAVLFSMVTTKVSAQNIAVKTSLTGDASANVTAGVEGALSQKWSVETMGSLNAWVVPDDMRWKHWEVVHEYRWWMCDIYGKSFLGAHVLGGQYNTGNIDVNLNFLGTDFTQLRDYRFQGWFVGLGVAYGYAWPLSRHWNLEVEAGFGWVYTRYDRYRCATCGTKLDENKPHNYVGPTRGTLNLVYVF